jgi:hypothetical protein
VIHRRQNPGTNSPGTGSQLLLTAFLRGAIFLRAFVLGFSVNIYFQPKLFTYIGQCVSDCQGQRFPLFGWASFEQLMDCLDMRSELLQVPFWPTLRVYFRSFCHRHSISPHPSVVSLRDARQCRERYEFLQQYKYIHSCDNPGNFRSVMPRWALKKASRAMMKVKSG